MAIGDLKQKSIYEKQIACSYFRKKLKNVLWYLFVISVFFVMTVIYEYEQAYRNMQYAVVITLFFGVLFGIGDYLRYRRHCLALLLALEKEEERIHYLPESKEEQEKLYQQMLEDEEQEKRKLYTTYDRKKKDMADYYTMWTHQIKTPIAALRLLLQDTDESICKSSSDSSSKSGCFCREEKQKELEELFKIEQYAEMALCYARLESISSDLLFKFCDIRSIAVRAIQKYAVLFLHSGLNFRLEEFELRAVTDEKWLSFVIEQILSNALKYTSQGGIAVYGSDEEGNEKEGRVSYLTIEDTGIGIRESDLPRIFERGFTGYNGRAGQKSTGIGLYLSYQIIKGLSHTISVKSSLGKGTKVILGFEQENF